MTVKLIPIQYSNLKYNKINPKIIEVPSNFEKQTFDLKNFHQYSLHTDYSAPITKENYIKNVLKNPLLDNLDEIKNSYKIYDYSEDKKKVSCLWKNEKWANEFAIYLDRVIKKVKLLPKIIEIHPPYKYDCKNIDEFIRVYKIFGTTLKKKLKENNYCDEEIKNIQFLIENRNSSSFLISDTEDMKNLLLKKKEYQVKLKMVVDIPQLLKREYNKNSYETSLNKLEKIMHHLESSKEIIAGIHLWGYKEKKAHFGNLNDLFNEFSIKAEEKEIFFERMLEIFDNMKLYFVPEINSGNSDFISMIDDLLKNSFEIIQE